MVSASSISTGSSLMMPGFPELAVILVIVLIFFGAGKLPEVFASMGEGVKRFREAQEGGGDAKDVTPPSRIASGADIETAEEVKVSDNASA